MEVCWIQGMEVMEGVKWLFESVFWLALVIMVVKVVSGVVVIFENIFMVVCAVFGLVDVVVCFLVMEMVILSLDAVVCFLVMVILSFFVVVWSDMVVVVFVSYGSILGGTGPKRLCHRVIIFLFHTPGESTKSSSLSGESR